MYVMVKWVFWRAENSHHRPLVCMSMTFPTYVKGCLEIIMTPIKAWVCLYTSPCACRSIFVRVYSLIWWRLCLPSSSSPLLSVSAGLTGQRKTDLLHAGCGNHNMHAKKMHMQLSPWSNMSAPVSKKGYVDTCEQKNVMNFFLDWNLWHVHWEFACFLPLWLSFSLLPRPFPVLSSHGLEL